MNLSKTSVSQYLVMISRHQRDDRVKTLTFYGASTNDSITSTTHGPRAQTGVIFESRARIYP